MIRRSLFLLLVTFFGLVTLALAQETPRGRVAVTPSKLEVTAGPGETVRREFTIVNQSTDNLNLALRFEDLAIPTNSPDGAVLAEGAAPIFPLTPYLSADPRDFTLAPNSDVKVPVVIQLPADMSPGSFHGAAVFSITPAEGETANTQVVTRLAPLIFLRVRGEAIERGTLLDFGLLGRRFQFSPVAPTFYLTFRNDGNVYLNPYGMVELKNRLGGEARNFQVDPWFVLPGATRIREIAVPEQLPAGWYQARLSLNPGYGAEFDIRTVNFVVINLVAFWLILLALIIILFVVIKRFRKIPLALLFIATLTNVALAEVASSTNYRLQADSLNFGGGLSTSANYDLESTFGEIATGNGTSPNYGLLAGYQQMISSTLAVTVPSDVTLSAITGPGVSDGSVAWTVTTDNPAGYTLSIKAGSSPALVAGSESFNDYSPAGANPDYNWSVGSSVSAFGFSPEGADTASRYLDNGSNCGVGASQTVDQCWDGFSTTNRTIAQSSTSNTPNGVATTVKLKAEVGSDKIQATASYTATLTVTATPR